VNETPFTQKFGQALRYDSSAPSNAWRGAIFGIISDFFGISADVEALLKSETPMFHFNSVVLKCLAVRSVRRVQ
jgi:hypothetical protein